MISAHISERNERIQRSMTDARQRAERDHARPMFHFRPLAQWMNDPNGTIYHNGVYHLFYQYNPYGDEWGSLHWGHARSRDLVSWEHLPIALFPAEERGEQHCYSGCAYHDPQAGPMLFYTSIGRELPEQWAAVGDAEWSAWTKPAENPILTVTSHQGIDVKEWRDPFIFEADDRTFMTLGGKIDEQPVALIYEKGRDAFDWTYQGVLFRHPETDFHSLECPNFFPLGDTWALLDSPYGPVEYFVGDFDADALTFTPETRGKVDYSPQFYATNMYCDDQRRWIMVGWIRGFAPGKGWNGCLSLPRVLSLGDDGHLRQTPLPELRQLRASQVTLADVRLTNACQRLEHAQGDQLKILAQIDPGDAQEFGLRVRCSDDGNQAGTISYRDQTLTVDGFQTPLPLGPNEPLTVHLFLDHAALEVFVNDGRACVTRVIDAPADALGINAFAREGSCVITRLDAWTMQSIW